VIICRDLGELAPREYISLGGITLDIPSLPPSCLEHCDIINIRYFIRVSFYNMNNNDFISIVSYLVRFLLYTVIPQFLAKFNLGPTAEASIPFIVGSIPVDAEVINTIYRIIVSNTYEKFSNL